MPEPAGARTLKELLLETVESLEELVVLVWFHDRGEGSHADSEEAARDSGLLVEAADTAFSSLAARGFLSPSSGNRNRFFYAPSSRQRDAVDAIAVEYRQNTIRVMRLMTENAIERVRTAALRTFAECFRVRGPRR